MKFLITIIFTLILSFFYSQTESHKEKYRHLEPDIWLGIWDKENSSKTIKIDTISYDEIPKYLDFRGTVVEAIKWNDKNGENILIQSVTGQFLWKEYIDDNKKGEYSHQDKSELYAYLFQKGEKDKKFTKKWRVYDFYECFGVDWFTGFIRKATTITDLDDDGITEISLPYVLICRGGMDPGEMKIIMYEGHEKYALRGSTMIMCDSEHPDGGEFKPSENLKEGKLFKEFLEKHWDRNKCEKGKFY